MGHGGAGRGGGVHGLLAARAPATGPARRSGYYIEVPPVERTRFGGRSPRRPPATRCFAPPKSWTVLPPPPPCCPSSSAAARTERSVRTPRPGSEPRSGPTVLDRRRSFLSSPCRKHGRLIRRGAVRGPDGRDRAVVSPGPSSTATSASSTSSTGGPNWSATPCAPHPLRWSLDDTRLLVTPTPPTAPSTCLRARDGGTAVARAAAGGRRPRPCRAGAGGRWSPSKNGRHCRAPHRHRRVRVDHSAQGVATTPLPVPRRAIASTSPTKGSAPRTPA